MDLEEAKLYVDNINEGKDLNRLLGAAIIGSAVAAATPSNTFSLDSEAKKAKASSEYAKSIKYAFGKRPESNKPKGKDSKRGDDKL